MPERRTLAFTRLDEVMPEVDRLLAGHATVGNWTLGQLCQHLAEILRLSVEGFGVAAPWPIRAILGPVIKGRVLRAGRIPAGMRVPEKFLPKPGLDARAEAEALRAAIAYYQAHPAARAPHPFFGRMTAGEWDRLHCIHCAHHLGFAVPA